MPQFFNASRMPALEAAALAWSGTPWRPNSSKRGVGASCHHAVAGVLMDAGFTLPPVPDGPIDWARHQSASLQEQWMDSNRSHFEKVYFYEPGDIVGFKLGSCIHHLGIILQNGRFFHCIKSTGASIQSTRERDFVKHAARFWRPMEH
jgi:cell wall-associated NlpC family hydrolase